MNKLVSVLIPAYNVESYIEESVKSILNQTYKNIEIIIVDDNSSDLTFEKLAILAKYDQRIRIFKNKENIKISKTLNIAFSHSKGDYILRMDGDDISEPDRIERKLDFLERNESIDVVGSSIESVSSTGKHIGFSRMPSDKLTIDRIIPLVSPLKHIWLSRRSVYCKLGGYRDIPGVEDYDFLLRAKFFGFRFTNISDYYGYKVRIGRDGNTINTIGYNQLLLKKMVYRDYLNGYEKSINYNIQEPAGIFKYLYDYSSQNLHQAIVHKSQGQYGRMCIKLMLSLASPHQWNYLYERIRLRAILLKEKK